MRSPVLHGELVRLRPLETRDAHRLWVSLRDPDSGRLTGMGTSGASTRAEVDAWAARAAELPARYDWAVTSAAVRDGELVSDDLIGEISLDQVDLVLRSASLRLRMMPDYRGRGYGREAIGEVLRFAFDGGAGPGLHRVSLAVISINPRARALYDSLGFREEGRLRDAFRDGKGWADAVVMSILEDEFRAGSGTD
ncbi:GNAT family N-acetyltransferase [Krasilnikoviella flava]|uniref:Protein N-acetyltransferase, RimJ/RimL family n=1 Tax=Krasilnikoviella flava TaxID=526729 RepID=A0A1T5KQ05_9MICO|nr:GNAT family protein [Krasilnikoviella flava]SKC65378.1 Protein N-acetyltransferase, RimJ/RimL family [Krasilnikoviella flava]